jgi:hypothetical protein
MKQKQKQMEKIFKKGSQAAKDHMAKVRAAKKISGTKKKPTVKQRGSSDTVRDKLLKAKPPGKRKSESGRLYTEVRKNRSDVKGKLLGIGDISLNAIGAELYELESRVNGLKLKKKQVKTIQEKKEIQTQITEFNKQFNALRAYLNSRARFK